MTHRPMVLVLDYGAQYSQLIARRIREAHVYCEIHPCSLSVAQIRVLSPDAIVMSGGPQSVYDVNAPSSDPAIFELGVPVLGICYGLQLMAKQLGGVVASSPHREYGPATLEIIEELGIFAAFSKGEETSVWMS